MRAAHRRAHFLVWLVLGPIVLAGFVAGIAVRREMPTQAPPVGRSELQSNSPTSKVADQ